MIIARRFNLCDAGRLVPGGNSNNEAINTIQELSDNNELEDLTNVCLHCGGFYILMPSDNLGFRFDLECESCGTEYEY